MVGFMSSLLNVPIKVNIPAQAWIAPGAFNINISNPGLLAVVIFLVLQLPDSSGNLRFLLQSLFYFTACFAIIGASVVGIVYRGKTEVEQRQRSIFEIGGATFTANQLIEYGRNFGLLEQLSIPRLNTTNNTPPELTNMNLLQQLSIPRLNTTNSMLPELTTMDPEVQLVESARDMGEHKFPKLMDGSDNDVMDVMFFFSQNNQVVHRLQGQGYWAYNTIKELFQALHTFNVALHSVEQHENGTLTEEQLKLIRQRRSTICFLDGPSMSSLSISEAIFLGSYRNINVIQSNTRMGKLCFDSIHIGKGCKAKFEHIVLKKVMSHGETELFRCSLEFSQDESIACGETISFVECEFGVRGSFPQLTTAAMLLPAILLPAMLLF